MIAILDRTIEKPFAPRPDSLYRTDSSGMVYRQDDRTGLIIPRALDLKESQAFMRKYAPTDIATYLPTMRDLPWGATDEFFDYTNETGEANISTGNNSDVNFVEVTVDEEGEKIITYEIAYRYTEMEMDAFSYASRNRLQSFSGNLAQYRLEAALKAIQTKEHFTGCYGAPSHGVNGMFNHPDVIPTDFDGTFDPYAQTEAVALHNWIVDDIYNQLIRQQTELVEQPNLMLIPQDLWIKLTTTFNTAGNETRSALTMLRETFSELGAGMRIVPRNELGNTYLVRYGIQTSNSPGGVSTDDRLVMCTVSPDNFNRRVSNVRPLPWKQELKGMCRVLQQRVRGVKFHYPRAAAYCDFATKP